MKFKYDISNFFRLITYLPIIIIPCFIISCASHVVVKKDYNFCRHSSIAIIDISVTDIRNQKTHFPHIGRSFANALVSHFLEAGFDIVERQKISALLHEMKINRSGLFDSSKISEIGRQVKANYLLTGSGEVEFIFNGTFLRTVTIRLIHVSSGQIVITGYWTGPSMAPVQVARMLGIDIRKKLSKQISKCQKLV